MSSQDSNLPIQKIDADFSVADLVNAGWSRAPVREISRNWDGSSAAPGRHFGASALWSDAAVYFRFDAAREEPLIMNAAPRTNEKTIGLWERDVCEIFVAPDKNERRNYFEFEIAPTGEWLDVAIDSTSGERVTDWDYRSGMEAAVEIEDDRIVMAMKIPWASFGLKPNVGDIWLGNIFRCVGTEQNRGHLAWRPTFTEKPNFHVPEKFGEFVFVP